MRILKKLRDIKLPIILNTVPPVNSASGPEYSKTVLNKIMHTASFVIPSPKIKLNNLGYSSYLTIEIAATTSVQHKREDMSRISITDSLKYSYSLFKKLVIRISIL
jgi:CRISPR/Cas system-associated endonuclease/helicase Cas3